jgi:hypothetical protein
MTVQPTTVQLTPEQSALWDEGGWSAFRIEETVIERLIALDITEPVTVMLDDGSVAFGITPPSARG